MNYHITLCYYLLLPPFICLKILFLVYLIKKYCFNAFLQYIKNIKKILFKNNKRVIIFYSLKFL